MLEVAAHPGAIISALAVHDRRQAAITAAVGEFDRDQSWALDGARSMKAWLIAFTGRSAGDAARLVRHARNLRQLPVTAAGYTTGQLSGGQIDAIIAHLSPTTIGLFTDHEAELIPTLVELPVRDVETVMARWRRHADALIDTEPPEPCHRLQISTLPDGTRILNGELHPVAGATVEHNLVLLCSFHHHLIHRHNCDTKLLPDNTFTITLPNHTTLTSRPPP